MLHWCLAPMWHRCVISVFPADEHEVVRARRREAAHLHKRVIKGLLAWLVEPRRKFVDPLPPPSPPVLDHLEVYAGQPEQLETLGLEQCLDLGQGHLAHVLVVYGHRLFVGPGKEPVAVRRCKAVSYTHL